MHTPDQNKEKEKDQDTREEFCQERRNPPAQAQASSSNRSALSFFRFVIWLTPGPVCILIVIGLSWLSFNSLLSLRLPPLIFIVLGIACTFGIGYFDALLSPSVLKVNNTPVTKAAIKHAIIFTLLQVVLAPLVVVALLFGFCALAT